MTTPRRFRLAGWTICGLAVAAIGFGLLNLLLAPLGCDYLAFSLLALPWRKRENADAKPADVVEPPETEHDHEVTEFSEAAVAYDVEGYVKRLLDQDRYMLLLRHEIAENVNDTVRQLAIKRLHECMSLVPDGDVFLQHPESMEGEDASAKGQLVSLGALFIDRFPVTNRQYRAFVLDGGYEDVTLWDETSLAAVFDFVDETGHPGPRFWHHGKYPKELTDHPVVGVSWYEADAYARWSGKRLPADPEWVKAGVWPVPTGDSIPRQRKYPWGDVVDKSRANLSAWGPGSTVPVTDFEEGSSVGGVRQMIGNVWEWTACEFGRWHSAKSRAQMQQTFKGLRGGAFDTYFESHATCQFQSGDDSLSRKYNIGFRCALSIHEIIPEALGGSS